MSLRSLRMKGGGYLRPHQLVVYRLRRLKSGRYSWVKDYAIGEPEYLLFSGPRLTELREEAQQIAREQNMVFIDIIWHGQQYELSALEELAWVEYERGVGRVQPE